MHNLILENSKKLKLFYYDKQSLVNFILLIPFVEPQLFKLQGYEQFDKIYSVIRAVSAILIFFFFILTSRQPSTACFLMLVMQGFILISTLVNHGSLGRFAGPAIISVAMFLLMNLASQRGENSLLQFLNYTKTLLFLFFIVNVISWVAVVTTGWIPNCFFGIDNRWIYLYLPLIWVSFSVDMAEKGKAGRASWAIWLACLVHLALVWSTGAVLAIAAWAPIWFIVSRLAKGKSKRYLGLCILALFFVLNIALVSGFLLNLVKPLITVVLKKDITLAGRTLLWKVTIQTVNQSPVFGRGVQSTANDIAFFLEKTGATACAVNHPHNYLLNVLFHGGYIAAVLFCLCHVSAVNAADRQMPYSYYVPFICLLVSYLLASLVDTLDYSLFYIPLAFASVSFSICKDVSCDREG